MYSELNDVKTDVSPTKSIKTSRDEVKEPATSYEQIMKTDESTSDDVVKNENETTELNKKVKEDVSEEVHRGKSVRSFE